MSGIGKCGLDILQLDPVPVHSLVRTGARPLQGNRDAGVALQGHPAELHIPEEHHPVRTPILHRVGEDIDVHEWAPGLAGSDLAQFAIGMAQPEGGLAGVRACSEQFKFEYGLEGAHAGRHFGFDAEPSLPDAEVGIAVGAKLILHTREAWLDARRQTSPGAPA